MRFFKKTYSAYMAIFRKSCIRIGGPGLDQEDSLFLWRVKIFTAFIIPMLILAQLAIIASFVMAIRHGIWFTFFLNLAAYMISVLGVFARSLSFKTRVMLVLSLFFFVGVYVTIFIGPLSGGPVWLFSFSIFTALLLGTVASIISVLMNLATVITIALLFHFGILNRELPFFASPENMTSALINFFLLNFSTSVSISVLVKSLISMQHKEEKLKNRLQRAERMEALGHLAGGVAHDLNNILSGIVTYPDMLLYTLPEDDPMYEPLNTIKQSGLRAAAVVQDLLSLARHHVPSPETINLNTLLSDYLKSPEHQALARENPHVEFKTEMKTRLSNISGSPVHLSKAVMNLIFNACESMSHEGTVTVRTEERWLPAELQVFETIPPGHYAVISVSDTGTGIKNEDLEHIFEPFYTRKKMGRSGTGLGLSVVWGAVRDNEGYIDVTSTYSGSHFALYFPLTDKIIDEGKEEVSPDVLKGNGEVVLVVDDLPDQLQIASDLLVALNYRPLTAASGEEALKIMLDRKVDLMILDMIMPGGMDGLETYHEALKIYPRQKALIASGFAETERIIKAVKPGLSAFLHKPYSLKEIGAAVAELIKDRKSN